MALVAATLRRLAYCLPMRTLAEQTEKKARMWLGNLGLLAGEPGVKVAADISGCGSWMIMASTRLA